MQASRTRKVSDNGIPLEFRRHDGARSRNNSTSPINRARQGFRLPRRSLTTRLPVTGQAHAGTIAREPSKAADAVGIAARAGTARATDAAAHSVSDHGSNVAEEPGIQVVAGPQLANAPTVTAQAISLDDEIKLLAQRAY